MSLAVGMRNRVPSVVSSRRLDVSEHSLVPESPVDAILNLQRKAGNQAVVGLLDSVFSAAMEVGQLLVAGERLLGESLRSGTGIDENRLTDELFWLEHPDMRGQRLRHGTPEAHRSGSG